MTVKELKEKLNDMPNDMTVFVQGFTEIKEVTLEHISERHSKEWMQPKDFVMLHIK